jgi:hypothetical protein
MSTLQQVSHRPEQRDHKTRPWALIAIAVGVVLAIAGIAWFAFNDGRSDIDVATELADTYAQGWTENDPDLVGSVFTDDAIISSEVEGFVVRRVWTKEETMQDVRVRGDAVIEARRVSELTETDDGTFHVRRGVHGGREGTYSGVIEIELDGNLLSRLEWLSLEHLTDS